MLPLAPRDVRRRYRAEMIATFDAASADAGARGTVPCAAFSSVKRSIFSWRAARIARPACRSPPASRADHAVRRTGIGMMEPSTWRQALRSLRRRPAFLGRVVLTLGFGAGITTAVFSLVDTVLIKPLPYPDADRLVTVYESSPSRARQTQPRRAGRLEDWNRFNRSFVALVRQLLRERHRHQRRRARAARGPPGGASVLRRLRACRRSPAAPSPTKRSRRTGPARRSSASASGRAGSTAIPQRWDEPLTIGGRPYEIVGVMPATFTSAATDVWLPAQTCAATVAAARRALPQRHRPARARRQRRGRRPRARVGSGGARTGVSENRCRLVGGSALAEGRPDGDVAARPRAPLRRRRVALARSPSRTSPGSRSCRCTARRASWRFAPRSARRGSASSAR